MHSTIDSEKELLRKQKLKEIRDYRNKAEFSAKAVEKLMSLAIFKNAEAILAFSPLKSEVDISPILNDKRILLPYIDNGEMRFSRFTSLIKSNMGFLEPKERLEADYDNALMLVPAIAYDSANNRLGRGGGFYDRYISENRMRLYTIGIAYPVSFTDRVPIGIYDERLNEFLGI